MQFRTAHSSRLGNRKNNQDRCAVFQRDHYLLLVLADGMGGHKHGEKAAQEVLDTFETVFHNIPLPISNERIFLQQLSVLAHNSIQEKHGTETNTPRTTCVCCLINGSQAIWAHSGDSRLYLFRDEHLYCRTRDHSYIEDMLQSNVITEEEANTHPMRNYVTACLGGDSNAPHVNISEPIYLKTGDTILLCSDGLWSAMKSKQLINKLNEESLDQAIEDLTDYADKHNYPHSDNCTGLVIRIDDDTPPTGVSTTHIQQPAAGKKDDLQKAINDIESAYHVYQNEISKK